MGFHRAGDARADDEQKVALAWREHRSVPVDQEDPAVVGDEDVGGMDVGVAEHARERAPGQQPPELLGPLDDGVDPPRLLAQERAQAHLGRRSRRRSRRTLEDRRTVDAEGNPNVSAGSRWANRSARGLSCTARSVEPNVRHWSAVMSATIAFRPATNG